ncbi:Serine/threonine-protein phosphatase CPPED1 [Gryllus bimaculatus]|nr:Serine/threonine-protein phosphatase CPPED1 [Gryllus bimaculatus]
MACINNLKGWEEEGWKSPWYFIQGADPQLGLIARYFDQNPIPNWDKEAELSEKLVEKINLLSPKPRFFIICGDMCDAVSSVEKAFCGHYHNNAGGMYKTMEVVVTSAIGAQLGDAKPGVRIVKVYEDKIEHTYYGIDDIPATVEL